MRAMTVSIAVLLASAAMAQTAPPKDEKPAPLPASLVPLEKKYKATKAVFVKKPKDKAAREAFIKATTIFGHETMVHPELPARTKYRDALRLYREVLKLEPNHPVAKKEHDLIVSIYEQMGRPVPK
jgi:hypothetical protein